MGTLENISEKAQFWQHCRSKTYSLTKEMNLSTQPHRCENKIVNEFNFSIVHFSLKAILFCNNITEAETMLLLSTLLNLYSYTPLQPVSWFRASYISLRMRWKSLRSVLSNGINRKDGTLKKSSFTLELGQVAAEFSKRVHFLPIYSSAYKR